MKDWDFDKFFPTRKSAEQSTPKPNVKNDKSSKPGHRRNDSDSKVNPFFRGFRRENSDFFPLSSRHSAIDIDQKARPSNIFSNRRGSDVAITKKSTGEPVLMDWKRTEVPPSVSRTKKTDAIRCVSSILHQFNVHVLFLNRLS